jgi:hypothetical protein
MPRAIKVAAGQWGVIGSQQLRHCGVPKSTISRWEAEGRLHLIHPGVHALGHPSIPMEGRLVAALLYAGSESGLSHATAAWWWRLLDEEPRLIEVSAASRIRSRPGLVVHSRRRVERTRHRRFPITTVPQTLLDYAAGASLDEVRRTLAKADYRRLLDLRAVEPARGQGRRGSSNLRRAIETYQPRLARARSRLEQVFIPPCESAGIPLPEVNVRIGRWTVDALWRRERLIVELDGYDNHRTPAQIAATGAASLSCEPRAS